MGRVKVISSGQNKRSLSKPAGRFIHMVRHVRSHSLIYTRAQTHTNPSQNRVPRFDTIMERWTVMISWLIAKSFLFLSSLGWKGRMLCLKGAFLYSPQFPHITWPELVRTSEALRLVPQFTTPHGNNNVSWEAKPRRVWQCAHVCPCVCMPKRQCKNYPECTSLP